MKICCFSCSSIFTRSSISSIFYSLTSFCAIRIVHCNSCSVSTFTNRYSWRFSISSFRALRPSSTLRTCCTFGTLQTRIAFQALWSLWTCLSGFAFVTFRTIYTHTSYRISNSRSSASIVSCSLSP